MLVSERLRGVWDVAADLRDIIDGRAHRDGVPPWAARRGWGEYLVNLSDVELAGLERTGLVAAIDPLAAPATLVEFCRRLREATRLAPLSTPGVAAGERGVSIHKRQQIHSLLSLSETLRARRVVDFGAGHGHLTRALRVQLGLPAIGFDRDAGRVARARAWGKDAGATFEHLDLAGGHTQLERGDLAVGLHACGALGDRLVSDAAQARAHVLLVGCCPQKIPGRERAPLSAAGADFGVRLPRHLLGLANLDRSPYATAQSMRRAMRGREVRHALRLLLRSRGVELVVGEEARGISRHQFRHGLARVAPKALRQRGLQPVTDGEVARYEIEGRAQFARIRRFSLPRKAIGRLLEVAFVLDRAAHLEEAGYDVRVGEAFDARHSPRNVGIVARA